MHQDSPNIKIVGVKMTQELFRKTEKRVEERGMSDVSQLIRFLVTEETINVPLTDEDRELIESRRVKKQNKKRG